MQQRTPLAGGFFLIAAILIGAVWGVATDHVAVGLEMGTAAGLVMAIAVWLVDRRR